MRLCDRCEGRENVHEVTIDIGNAGHIPANQISKTVELCEHCAQELSRATRNFIKSIPVAPK